MEESTDRNTAETMELIKFAQGGDSSAKEKLILENSGLIWSIVRKFLGRGYESEDLYQIGAIGLIKCIEKFDMSYDVKFSTYAVPMIMGEIRRFMRDDGMIKVSRPLKETATKAKFVREQMMHKNGDEPTVSELANEMGIEREDLVEALDASREVESIYKTIYRSDGSSAFLIDKLTNSNTSDEITDNLTLRQILLKLEPKERKLIFLRYFRDKTQSETAKEIGISQVQVSRLEKKIINEIRDSFGA
ncbi:MAG: SigF/SigG family RNA polymerase sporulation sigma factor [Candidatus Metalachnospira sp.]|nr:SigF/SigG family RNA polymerase sporulation sigma factor [Candidatus Metalachnospira sp.]